MIDWISVIFPVSLDLPSARVVHLSPDGEIEFEVNKGHHVEGSYSSRVLVKVIPEAASVARRANPESAMRLSMKNRLYISGNPTKFLQGHNVWGVNDFQPLMYRFIEAVCCRMAWNRDVTDRLLMLTFKGVYDISRIDLTESFILPCISDVRAWIRSSSQVAHGKCQGVNSYQERTLYMGKNSRRMTIKIYAKGDEIRKHKLPPELEPHLEWLQPIADRLLRVEVTLRTMALRDAGLHHGKEWSAERVRDVFRLKIAKLNIPENAHMPVDTLESLPNHLQGYVAMWQAGVNIKERVSKASYYRIRKELLPFGIDIKSPPAGQSGNVVPLIRVITAEPFEIPTEATEKGLLYIPENPAFLRRVK